MPFAEYFAQAVDRAARPHGALAGSPATPTTARSTTSSRSGASFSADARRARDARRGDDRPVPGSHRRPARARPDGAERLGPRLRAARRQVAALDRHAQLAAHVRPFRRSGTFLWVDPDAGSRAVSLPTASSATGRRRRGPRSATRCSPSSSRRRRRAAAAARRTSPGRNSRPPPASWPDTVAVRGTSIAGRDLAEVVAGPEHAARA